MSLAHGVHYIKSIASMRLSVPFSTMLQLLIGEIPDDLLIVARAYRPQRGKGHVTRHLK